MSRRRAAALALAGLALAGAGCGEKEEPEPAPEPERTPGGGTLLGYNEAFQPSAPAPGLLEDSGAGFVRTPLNWAAAEPEPGALDFSVPDAIAEELDERGLAPLWVVTSAPCWATSRPGCDPAEPSQAPSPAHYDEYAAFVVEVAERYPEAIGVEVWNEPNVPAFWRPRPDAAAYRELLERTVASMEQSGPEVPVVLGGLAPTTAAEVADNRLKIRFEPFLRQVLAGEPPPVDAIGFHPYSLLVPGSDPVRTSLELYDQAAGLAGRLAPGIPVWVTEVGLTTAGRHRVSPRRQASGLATIYEQLADRGVPVIAIHRFLDQASPTFPFEAGFGVVGAGGAPKPAYCSVASAAGADPEACS